MSLKDALRAGLTDMPDCQTIAYVDMPSGLVLGSVGRVAVAQERLDRLATVAATLLQSPALAQAAAELQGAEVGTQGSLVLLSREGIHAFVRAETFPEHALCYICDATADPGRLDAQIRAHRSFVALAI